MRVLLLSPHPSDILDILRNDTVTISNTIPEAILEHDFLVSYRFRHIIRDDVVFEKYGDRAINLHISMLPHNRGADPVYWAIRERSPMGVTIHVLTKGVDCGPIYAQKLITNSALEYSESYEAMMKSIHYAHIVELFRAMWPLIRDQRITPIRQPKYGTYHYAKDRPENELY